MSQLQYNDVQDHWRLPGEKPLALPNGSASRPALTFVGDEDSGLYRGSDGTIYVVINKQVVGTFTTAGLSGSLQGATVPAGGGTATITPSGVFYVDPDVVANDDTADPTVLKTVPLPADTLNADGKSIRILAFGALAANTDVKNLTFDLEGTEIFDLVLDGDWETAENMNIEDVTGWSFKCMITRRASGEQIIWGEVFLMAGTSFAKAYRVQVEGSEDETAAVNFVITATPSGINEDGNMGCENIIAEILN